MSRRRHLDPTRKRFHGDVVRRFFVRFHLLLICAGVLGVGLALNRLWLTLGFTHLVWRSVFNCLVTWGVFLGAVRLWVLYLHASEPRLAALSPHDAASAPADPPQSQRDRNGAGLADGTEATLEGASGLVEIAGAAAEAEIVGVIIGGIALAAAGLVVFAAVFPWLWIEVPALLIEGAFQVALSASIVRRAGRLETAAQGPGWLNVLVSGTWVAALVVTLLVLLVTCIAYMRCGAPARLSGCFQL